MGRILSGGGRPAWYDRNPSPQVFEYSIMDLAPHTITIRWTYTVPSGRKAFLEMAQGYLRRSTTATTVGVAYILLGYQPSGGSMIYVVRLVIRVNTVDRERAEIIGQALTMNVGDQIAGGTSDNSTGGLMDYTVAAKVTEFDA